ncbi:hypothetical protein ASPZODRAFT_63117 [Penicilliopsis zonata CBS 506.65]|uniref:Ima1 N-terminal domain-containing protein n=1 Tax=Penicilliopsis zonata CBS 506.65 TaxID=1073090 RepID=A0A1L9SK94_9EURO|nr:hypothetical protein ASPZODRAFT_63117 [Penicilliopsis zonata CBS 506.65]OJJ47474.1 hypothetical protein ASPZODRAFT_63117 [Penicilliopsis zonata CBS 506.65]
MASLFNKRLSCFYCGRRSDQVQTGSVRKWHCKHCEAINYLDEKGEITDPPADETNAGAYGADSAFESIDFTESGLFCAKCVRNQHLFMSALASYFPPSDDPAYSAYEKEYPLFRQNLEERYPQVCERCEPRVTQRIRQTGYEAKSDHLRRMMDRSKAGRAARQARSRNWRSVLVFAGALGYWGSVAGQLAWDSMAALNGGEPFQEEIETSISSSLILSCMDETVRVGRIPGRCSFDLVPLAGLSLVMGILSLWWNPKLRLKVEGKGGRFSRLGEYYRVQLIVMVVRCVFWAVLKDPSSSGLQADLRSALHWFMLAFTLLSVLISRRIVTYEIRPLVSWTESVPAVSPNRLRDADNMPSTANRQSHISPSASVYHTARRFPLEKLALPRTTPVQEPAVPPTPPPEADDMDWTPSLPRNIRPTISVHQRDQKSVLDGPLPFYGALPPAPQAESWGLRNRQVQKPIEQVVERNPFQRTPTQSPTPWQHSTGRPEASFAQPKFFPMSDHAASTGLESLFDRTFTIRSPEDDRKESWQSNLHPSYPVTGTSTSLTIQYLRLGLLAASIAAWLLSQNDLISIPGNYIEVASLGSASLISGFALLEALKRPMFEWNGMEILVYVAELATAVHLGANLPRVSFAREYFDRYGKLLLIFMAVQEALGLFALYRNASTAVQSPEMQSPPTQPHSPNPDANTRTFGRAAGSPRLHEHQSFTSESAVPELTYSPTTVSSSFLSQQPAMQQKKPVMSTFGAPAFGGPSLNRESSLTYASLKGYESDYDALERDSDTETTVTTATTATNATSATMRNIRYGRTSNDAFFSPRRAELGPGIDGLSLEDKPTSTRRVTRSQTQRQQGDAFRKNPLRRPR